MASREFDFDFSPSQQVQLLNQVRVMLPFDTGNLRYNGTLLYKTHRGFKISIGGVRADYVEHLEENPSSKWYKHIADNIAPTVMRMAESMAFNKPYVNRYRVRGVRTQMDKELGKSINNRNDRLIESLGRSNVEMDEHYFTRKF
jgi:hypothetical protein